MTRTQQGTDGGWGWVIVFAVFMVYFLIDGVRYSFGLMLVEWHKEFGGGMAKISGIASCMFGLILIAAPVSGILVNKYGCRSVTIAGTVTAAIGLMASVFAENVPLLYFTFGSLGGLGFSMMFITGYVVIIQYFDKRRSLAIGLAVLGSGSGGLVFNPVSKWLLEQFGWRGTLLIESGLLLNAIACGLVMRPVESKENSVVAHSMLNSTGETACNSLLPVHTDQTEKETKSSDSECNINVTHRLLTNIDKETVKSSGEPGEVTQIVSTEPDKTGTKSIRSTILKVFRFDLLQKKRFLLFAVMIIFINISYMVPFIYVFDMALAMGHPSYKAVWLLTSMSIANVVSRVPVGLIADLPRVNTLYMMGGLYVSSGIFTGFMPLCHLYELLLIACIMFSASIVSGMVLIPVVLSKLFGDDVIADSFGLSLLFGGLAGLIGPSLTGALFDWTHGYLVPFVIAGTEFMIGGVVVCLIPCIVSE